MWEIVQFINLSPKMQLGRKELLRKDETLADTGADMTLKRSIVLCSIFEDLMRSLGWKVGDTLAIEEDICDVVGKLMIEGGRNRS